jgi:hypothetical protein
MQISMRSALSVVNSKFYRCRKRLWPLRSSPLPVARRAELVAAIVGGQPAAVAKAIMSSAFFSLRWTLK